MEMTRLVISEFEKQETGLVTLYHEISAAVIENSYRKPGHYFIHPSLISRVKFISILIQTTNKTVLDVERTYFKSQVYLL